MIEQAVKRTLINIIKAWGVETMLASKQSPLAPERDYDLLTDDALTDLVTRAYLAGVVDERERAARVAENHLTRIDARGFNEHGTQCLDHRCHESIARAIRTPTEAKDSR